MIDMAIHTRDRKAIVQLLNSCYLLYTNHIYNVFSIIYKSFLLI